MECLTGVADLRQRTGAWRAAGERVGLVPTMGNLHAGHLALVDLAREKADRVVVTVFVNPAQFSPDEDFNDYPRTLEQDTGLLTARGCDLLFAPLESTIYPDGTRQHTQVSVPLVSQGLCSDYRPGHFQGVATVVSKLFGMVQPDIAIFGQKDYQQLLVIRKLAEDLAIPVEILAAPTVREASGLALSSRNRYLTVEDRLKAPVIYQCIQAVRDEVCQGVATRAAEQNAVDSLAAAGLAAEYVAVRRARDLQAPCSEDEHLVVLAAARVGSARLIDNLLFSRTNFE
jgi:pantoate--beta-alanine ligase